MIAPKHLHNVKPYKTQQFAFRKCNSPAAAPGRKTLRRPANGRTLSPGPPRRPPPAVDRLPQLTLTKTPNTEPAHQGSLGTPAPPPPIFKNRGRPTARNWSTRCDSS